MKQVNLTYGHKTKIQSHEKVNQVVTDWKQIQIAIGGKGTQTLIIYIRIIYNTDDHRQAMGEKLMYVQSWDTCTNEQVRHAHRWEKQATRGY